MKLQLLFCGPGNHEWKRPAQRGKLPEACPDHRDQKQPKSDIQALLPAHRAEVLTQALDGAKKREPLGIIRVTAQEIAYLQTLLGKQPEALAAQILRRM